MHYDHVNFVKKFFWFIVVQSERFLPKLLCARWVDSSTGSRCAACRTLSPEWRPGFPPKSLLSRQLLLLLHHHLKSDQPRTLLFGSSRGEKCVWWNWFWDFAENSLVADQKSCSSERGTWEGELKWEGLHVVGVTIMAVEQKSKNYNCKSLHLD